MSNNLAIKISGLSKLYKLYDTPFDRLKEALSYKNKKYHTDFYALNNIDFEIKKGETVGIIGKNGSGKSTLLKIITGVLTPTNGTVQVNGKIAALLELGAGFNPEYTGLENIYFQGTIMGYSKEEVDQKIDAIIEFADIGEFINQPVKTYSSGMFARLAFSVAINVDPDILIVDEALSVGDALFQKRCFQKMEEFISRGNTLLFVSHDQESIRTLTDRALLLKNGNIIASGTSSEVVLAYRKELHNEESLYLQHVADSAKEKKLKKESEIKKEQKKETNSSISVHNSRSDSLSFGDGGAMVTKVTVFNSDMEEWSIFYPNEKIVIKVDCIINKDLSNLNVSLRIRNKEGVKIYSWGTLNQDMLIMSGDASGSIFWDNKYTKNSKLSVLFEFINPLGGNLYEIQAIVSQEKTPDYLNQKILHWVDEAAFFQSTISVKGYFFGGISDLKMKADLYEI